MVAIKFLGASRNVTGSRFLLDTGEIKGLVDCGLYQEREFAERNFAPFPAAPSDLSFVLLTHAHLDHSGYLPRLVKEGFRGPIFATAPTIEITKIALEDAAKIYREDIEKKQTRHTREGRVSSHPYEPLYSEEEAKAVFPLFREIAYGTPVTLGDNLSATFHNAGHILGSATIEVTDGSTGKRAIFSGDLGRPGKPLLANPETYAGAETLVIESTYGDRNHENDDRTDEIFAAHINEAYAKHGNIVIPSFAIERTQELIY